MGSGATRKVVKCLWTDTECGEYQLAEAKGSWSYGAGPWPAFCSRGQLGGALLHIHVDLMEGALQFGERLREGISLCHAVGKGMLSSLCTLCFNML